MKALEKPAVQKRGVLLPQHFELRDQYLEALLDEWLGVLSPFLWGLTQLEVDSAALAKGVFHLTAAVVRFASGEVALVRLTDPPLEVALPQEALADRSVDVFLGLVALEDGPNASEAQAPHTATRYRSVPAQPPDRGPALRPRLRLFVDGHHPLPSDSVRISRVTSTLNGVELDSRVLPPMIWPLEGTFLPGAIAAIVRALTARQGQLIAARRERPHEPLAFSAEQVPSLLALSAIQQALAALTRPVSHRGIHPWELHRILSELLGAIDAMEGRAAAAVPVYAHDDSGPGFRVLIDRLLAAIPVLARAPHQAFAFRRRDAMTFELKLSDPSPLRRRTYLVLTGGERGSLEVGVPAHAKVASDAWMPKIIQTAVRGIELAPDFDPPASLPSNALSACFRLNTRSEYFADVLERGSLVFHLPNALAELRVVLYVMNER